MFQNHKKDSTFKWHEKIQFIKFNQKLNKYFCRKSKKKKNVCEALTKKKRFFN